MNTEVNFRLAGGNNFLKAFALILDYPNATLSLAPNMI
jgi:hypothetical protein